MRPKLALLCLLCSVAACEGQPETDAALQNEQVEVSPGIEPPLGKADQSAPMMVEVKMMIASADLELAAERLKLSPSKAERREVYFYDRPDLALFDAGLILRARKVIDGPDDSTIKMRPLQPGQLSNDWFELDGFKCEIDQVGDKEIPSCSLTTRQDQGEIDGVAAGGKPIDKLFSSEQELFASTQSPLAPAWDDMQVLGPVQALVWKLKSSWLSGTMTAERWELPDRTVILEVSMKAPKSEASQVQSELAAYLDHKGLAVDNDQETKTRAVLGYFALQK